MIGSCNLKVKLSIYKKPGRPPAGVQTPASRPGATRRGVAAGSGILVVPMLTGKAAATLLAASTLLLAAALPAGAAKQVRAVAKAPIAQPAAATATANPCRASLDVGDYYYPPRLSVISSFVMPGETRRIEVNDLWKDETVVWEGATKRLRQVKPNVWVYSAPGWHPHQAFLRMHVLRNGQVVSRKAVTFVTLVPRSQMRGDYLNGYKIGEYPKNRSGNPEYTAPRGFIEVTKENRDLWVSDHFKLGDFVCKQYAEGPKYMALSERLLLKLEKLQSGLEARYAWARLKVVSGYRTPCYNRDLGNLTTFSRHIYGAAADLYIEEDPEKKPARRELLLASRSSDYKDARVLVKLVRELDSEATSPKDRGGLGYYACEAGRRAFIHTDCRGRVARW